MVSGYHGYVRGIFRNAFLFSSIAREARPDRGWSPGGGGSGAGVRSMCGGGMRLALLFELSF